MSKEELGKEFLSHVNSNYNQIKLSFKKQFRKKFCYDSFTDSIINVHDRIIKSGFTFRKNVFSGDCFVDFLFLTYKNKIMNTTTGDLLYQKKMDRNYDLSNDECYLPDLTFDESEGLDKQTERLYEDYLIDEIFNYAERNFTAMETGFFKMYYKNKLSLQEISVLTNYPKTYVWQNVNVVREKVLMEFENIKLPNRNKR